MSATTIEHLDRFWELLDEFLNAVLFVMIGLEVLVLILTWHYLVAGLIAVAIVLVARLISVGMPVWLLRRWERFQPSLIPMLTWGVCVAASRWPWPCRCPTSSTERPSRRGR
jgi:CPA1 family monovalent cation:H+ antiporter